MVFLNQNLYLETITIIATISHGKQANKHKNGTKDYVVWHEAYVHG